MNTNASAVPPAIASTTGDAVLKRLLQVAVGEALLAGVLFGVAGRLRWRAGWGWVGLNAGVVAVNALTILPKDPELIAERGRWAQDIKGWDRMLSGLIGLLWFATLAVSGLEARLRWSRKAASSVQTAGAVFCALSYGLVSWAMASNRFFSTAVRIQSDRGHAVASGGPYRFVRHPGYVGMIASWLATPVLLGSRWAALPAGITAALFVARTALEDRTLLKELAGYMEYAGRVRYRLLPRVW